MYLKGVFKDSGGFVQLVLFAGIAMVGIIAANVISLILAALQAGSDMMDIMAHLADFPAYTREIQFFTQIGVFIVPALLCAFLFSKNSKDYLCLNTPFNGSMAFWTVLSIIFALPFLNLVAQLNQQMVFPDFLKGLEKYLKLMEETNAKVIESMMRTGNIWAILSNILIVAVFAAIGEELTFRGALQRIFGKMIRNKHIIIWSVAFIFSFIHFQFYGFVPRLLLGAYLGYLLDYTKNLWIPILAHFTNNFIGVVAFTIYQDDAKQVEAIDALGYGSTWWLSVLSLLLFVFAFWRIRKQRV